MNDIRKQAIAIAAEKAVKHGISPDSPTFAAMIDCYIAGGIAAIRSMRERTSL